MCGKFKPNCPSIQSLMSKEALLLCVDVGHTMDEEFSEGSSRARIALECCKLTLQQKLFNNATHELGLMCFGDNDSDDGNSLILKELSRPTIDFVRKVEELSHARFENARPGGDIFSALNTAVDHIELHCGTKKYNKRMFLFTNGSGASVLDVKDLRNIAERVGEMGIKVNIIPVDFMVSYNPADNTLGGEMMDGIQERNAAMLMRLKEYESEFIQIFPASMAIELYKRFRKRDTNPVAKYKGNIEFAPGLNAQVATYKAIRRYDASVDFDPVIPKEKEITLETNYVVQGDVNGAIVDKENIVNAFFYGPQLVPISPILEAGTKIFEDKNLKVLGFVEKSKVPRHCLLSEVDIVVPQESPFSRKLFSSMIYTMLTQKKYALARYVARNSKNGVVPKMVILIPYRSSSREMFYLVELPTVEDVRDYPFNSLKKATEKQREIVRGLVDKMMLHHRHGEGEVEEVKVENTFNPTRQYFYQTLFHKALNPDQEEANKIPPLDPVIKNYMTPENAKYEAAQVEIAAAKKEFKFARKIDLNEKKAKQKKHIVWKDLVSDISLEERPAEGMREEIEEIEEAIVKPFSKFSIEDEDEEVRFSPVNPVSSFKKMVGFNKKDLVAQALKQMNEFILNKLTFAVTAEAITLLAECSAELRRACVTEQEAKYWDSWFTDLKNKKESFYDHLKEQGIGLIAGDNRDLFRPLALHVAPINDDEMFDLD